VKYTRASELAPLGVFIFNFGGTHFDQFNLPNGVGPLPSPLKLISKDVLVLKVRPAATYRCKRRSSSRRISWRNQRSATLQFVTATTARQC
jgi:hypothetical protein